MKYFLAKIIYRIVCGSGNHTPQFDEQLRIIFAGDEAQALEKAKYFGMKEQDSFMNEERRLVQWQFIDVSELYEVSQESDGAEVWSRITEQDHAQLYIKGVRRKASALHLRYNENLLPCF